MIIAEYGRNSRIAAALGPNWKGKLSWALYLAAIGLSFVQDWLACALYALVATLWFIPSSWKPAIVSAGGKQVQRP